MPVIYTDDQIRLLMLEDKRLPGDWRKRTQLVAKRGHRERQLDVRGAKGNECRLIFRQSTVNVLDFSVILAVRVPNSNQVFRLRRCNGRSHEHTNHIEGESFYDFHIHFATERYQEVGAREDTYARPTDGYQSYHDALDHMLADASFHLPPELQRDFFEEGGDVN